MPKNRESRCPEYGEMATEPYKTWERVVPFPDKKMRITVTMLDMFKCPSCAKNFRGLASKTKHGAEGIEV